MRAILFGPEGPNYSAEGIVTGKFVNMLKAHGWEVIWIYHQISSSKATLNADAIGIANYRLAGISKKVNKIPILRNIAKLDSLLWVIKAYFKALKFEKNKSFDIVLSRIMPAYGHLPALLFAKRKKKKWIANWSDPMPRIKAPYPYGKGAEAPIPFLAKLYLNLICKYAAIHTFPSLRLQNHYLKYLRTDEQHCAINPHISTPIPVKANTEKNDDMLVISHIGGGLAQRDPTLFFKALANVLETSSIDRKKICVQFIGPIEGNIENIINNSPAKDVIKLKGKVSYHDSIKYIMQSDVILVIEAKMQEGIFLPSKIADIVSCNRPIFAVSPAQGTVHDLISCYGGGLFTNCESESSIENGLKLLIEDWKQNKLSHPRYDMKKMQNTFNSQTIYQTLSNHLTTT